MEWLRFLHRSDQLILHVYPMCQTFWALNRMHDWGHSTIANETPVMWTFKWPFLMSTPAIFGNTFEKKTILAHWSIYSWTGDDRWNLNHPPPTIRSEAVTNQKIWKFCSHSQWLFLLIILPWQIHIYPKRCLWEILSQNYKENKFTILMLAPIDALKSFLSYNIF